MFEPELTRAVELCLPDGRLNPQAVGWARQPLHRCNLSGAVGRKKRWDYWCVLTDTHLLSVTLADLDYLGLASVLFVDLLDGSRVQKALPIPGGLGISFPDTVCRTISFERFGLGIRLIEEPGRTRMQLDCRLGRRLRGEIVIDRSGRESLNVVIPWSQRRFQFTSKQVGHPASGTLQIGDRRVEFGPQNNAWACLDYGRGVWPWRTSWNWGAAFGEQGGRRLGLSLGARWTDGSGMTESGLLIDGRLHKIGGRMRFDFDRGDPLGGWRVYSPDSDRVHLQLDPGHHERMALNLGLLSADLQLCFGRYHGTIVDDDGQRYTVDGLTGWAEELHARW